MRCTSSTWACGGASRGRLHGRGPADTGSCGRGRSDTRHRLVLWRTSHAATLVVRRLERRSHALTCCPGLPRPGQRAESEPGCHTASPHRAGREARRGAVQQVSSTAGEPDFFCDGTEGHGKCCFTGQSSAPLRLQRPDPHTHTPTNAHIATHRPHNGRPTPIALTQYAEQGDRSLKNPRFCAFPTPR